MLYLSHNCVIKLKYGTEAHCKRGMCDLIFFNNIFSEHFYYISITFL